MWYYTSKENKRKQLLNRTKKIDSNKIKITPTPNQSIRSYRCDASSPLMIYAPRSWLDIHTKFYKYVNDANPTQTMLSDAKLEAAHEQPTTEQPDVQPYTRNDLLQIVDSYNQSPKKGAPV